LWLPVALGAGAGLYFALSFEPPEAWAWSALAAGALLALVAAMGWMRVAAALLAALLLGFGLAKAREMRVATPIPDHAIIAHLTGRVVSLEPRETGTRVVLDQVRSGAFAQPPRRIRVALRGQAGFHPGDWLSLTAKMDAPPPPSEPGARDIGRELYFQSIGATGFGYGRARIIIPAGPPTAMQRLSQTVEDLRQRMTARIRSVLPGSTGGIAAALVTGARGGIAEDDEAALRDAGLAHVLAIAGLHMALVGGGLFWLVRAVLAAFPAVALNYSIKKWAAGAALAAGGFYLVISGAASPTVRAFVMFAFVMLAVLVDRPALTMRSLALAAAVLLALRPDSIVEPGFQMSFAAVAALIAVAEWEARRRVSRGAAWRYVHGIIATSLVGSFATLPFALFHFGRAAHYAVLGNLLAMPVMGFWVMPAAALAVLLMPLGWDAPALMLIGWGIEVMVALGRWVSGLPGAVSQVAAMPVAALVAMALGGLWLVIWRTRLRWWGLAPVAVGVALAWTARAPDMLVAPDAVTVAIRGEDGRLHFVRKPKDKFIAQDWLRRDGDGRDIEEAVGMPGLRCDGVGCAVKRGGVQIALPLRPEALAEDCARAQVLVGAVTADCKGPSVLIDQRNAGQGWAVRLSPLRAESVRAARGERPWVAP
jgi:competence protein ComEC